MLSSNVCLEVTINPEAHKVDRARLFDKEVRIALLKRDNDRFGKVFHADNCHDVDSGRWPIHIHKPGGGIHYFIFLADTIFNNSAEGLYSYSKLHDFLVTDMADYLLGQIEALGDDAIRVGKSTISSFLHSIWVDAHP